MVWRMVLLFWAAGAILSAQAGEPPRLVLGRSGHTWAPVFEGEHLEHAFGIENHGGRPLHILDVHVA